MDTFEIIAAVILTGVSLATVFRILLGWFVKSKLWKLPLQGIAGRFAAMRPTAVDESVVHQLAVVTTLNLPLADSVSIAARGETGSLSVILRRVSEGIAEGNSLSTALRQATASCPLLISSTVAAGERCGRLAPMLSDLDEMYQDQRQERPPSGVGAGVLTYPFLVLLIAMLVLTLIMSIVIPKFREIFLDFDVELPAITEHLIGTLGMLLGSSVFPIILFIGLLLGLVLAFEFWMYPVSLHNGDPILRMISVPLCWIPGLTRPIAFGHGMSLTLRVFRHCLAGGMTLSAGARLAATVRVNRFLQRRWEFFAQKTASGLPASTAARAAGLGSVFARACRNMERNAADPQLALQHAADYHRAVALRWQSMLIRVGWPVLVFLLGCLICYIVLALFLPLVTLINSTLDIFV